MSKNDSNKRTTAQTRRSLLRNTAGVTGGLLVGGKVTNGAGASSTGTTADIPDDATVINVEDESSIDEDGDLGAEIQSYCDDLSTIDHAFVVPSGTYSWNTMVSLSGSEFFGLVGDGEPTFEVRDFIDFVVQPGNSNASFDAVLLQNFVVDIDATDQYGNEIDAGVCNAFAEAEALIEDITLEGQRQRYHEDERVGGTQHGDHYVVGRSYTVRLDITDPDGEGVVRNVSLPDGGVHTYAREEEGHGPGEGQGFSSDGSHEGTIYWQNCYAEEYLGNSFYMWSNEATGTNVLEDCEVVNGYRTAIRLGRNDEAYDCTVTYDDVDESYHTATSPTGLWLGDADGALPIDEDRLPYVENLTITSTESPGEIVRCNTDTTGAEINGLEIEALDGNEMTIGRLAADPGDLEDILFENFTISDTSGSGGALNYGIGVTRPDIEFRDGTFEFDGADSGIRVDEYGTRFDNVEINVSNGETGLRLGTGDVEMIDTHIEGEADEPAILRLGSNFDWDSTTVAGNSFENVELANSSGEDLTLEDFEGEETGGGGGGDWIDLGSDDDVSDPTNESGVLFEAKDDLAGISCRISQNTEDQEMAYLRDSEAEVVAETDISSLGSGDAFDLSPPDGLDASNTYSVTIDGDGEHWDRGEFRNASYPYENDLLEVTHGVYTSGQTTSSSVRYGVTDIRALAGELGTAVSLPDPETNQATSDLNGVYLNVQEEIAGVRCTIASGADAPADYTEAFCVDGWGDVISDVVDVSDVEPGESFDIMLDEPRDADFGVGLANQGDEYHRSRYESPDYPYGGDEIDVDAGLFNSGPSLTDGVLYNFEEVIPILPD